MPHNFQPSSWLKHDSLKNAVDLLVRRRRDTDDWNYGENIYSNIDPSSGKKIKLVCQAYLYYHTLQATSCITLNNQ
jgi:hypothetical protein